MGGGGRGRGSIRRIKDERFRAGRGSGTKRAERGNGEGK